MRLFAGACVCLLLLSGCARSRPIADESLKTADTEPIKEYELIGEVKRLDPQERIATIAHEQIGDWMGPMTMEFPVRDEADFAKLREGQPVRAKVFVQGYRYWVANVEAAPAK
jgi:Cu/Ag efflux protein CusF